MFGPDPKDEEEQTSLEELQDDLDDALGGTEDEKDEEGE